MLLLGIGPQPHGVPSSCGSGGGWTCTFFSYGMRRRRPRAAAPTMHSVTAEPHGLRQRCHRDVAWRYQGQPHLRVDAHGVNGLSATFFAVF